MAKETENQDVVDITDYILNDSEMPTVEFEFINDSKIELMALTGPEKDKFENFQQKRLIQAIYDTGASQDFWNMFGKIILKTVKGWKDLTYADVGSVVLLKKVPQDQLNKKVKFSEKTVELIFKNSVQLSVRIMQLAANRQAFLMEEDTDRLNV